MRFERAERVIYEINPLVEVVCQIRFPRILQIDSELPVEFQKKLRKEYPIVEVQDQVLSVHATLGSQDESPSRLETLGQGERTYRFLDESRKWCINLTSRSIALSTEHYDHWESFSEKLALLIQTMIEIYEPAAFERIGLRYRDFIVRKNLGLESVKWSDLLNHHLIAMTLQPPITEDAIIGTASHTALRLDTGFLMLQTANVRQEPGGVEGFLIDADFYAEGRKDADANTTIETLSDFNIQAGGLFRWCIKERLHRALKPRAIT